MLDNMTTAIIMVTILDKMTSNRRNKLLYASMVILSANSGGAFSHIRHHPCSHSQLLPERQT